MSLSDELLRAMEAECATAVEDVVASRREADLDALRAMLREDADVPASFRQTAIQILGRWRDSASAAAIISLVPGFNERERINAVDALGQIGGPEAETAVLSMAEDNSSDVRRFAAYALSRFATDSARIRLLQLETADPERSVRAAAARSLRREQ